MRKTVGLVLFVALTIAGCGSSGTNTSAPTTTARAAQLQAEQREFEQEKKEHETPQAKKHEKEVRENDKKLTAQYQEREHEAAATSNAKKLVEIWKQEPVEASDSNVVSISHHLVSLSHKCSQDIPTLVGEIHSGVEILKKAGKNETPVEIAAGYDKAAPGKNVISDCRSVLAGLLTLIENG
jgi:hypothetical protein